MTKVIFLFLAFIAGWFFSQLAKLITGAVQKRGKLKFSDIVYYMTKSGGMPSGHTASFVAFDTMLGLSCGFDTPVFALAVCMTIIIIYDAVNVRYAVGEHGRILNEIAVSDNNPKTVPQRIVEGHTIPQVTVGAILGVGLGVAIYFICGMII